MSLNPRAFALTSGLVWGVSLFLLTWWIIAFDGASGDVTWIGRVCRGYSVTPFGSVVGLGWAFVYPSGTSGKKLFSAQSGRSWRITRGIGPEPKRWRNASR
jgi:hypothetical protein